MTPPRTSQPAGKPSPASQTGELASAQRWVETSYRPGRIINALYETLFGLSRLDYRTASVLDVGAGPISVFEQAAPVGADVVPYDTLADQYNQLIPSKKFKIVARLPARRFRYVALLNCLDHMDDPEELLLTLERYVEPRGEIWIYSNIDRPYDQELHPQDFKFWQIVLLVHRHYDIVRCGLVREGRLFPYAWWAVCRSRRRWPSPALRLLWAATLVAWCGRQYLAFHSKRAAVKAVKLVGLRRLLPRDLQF